MIIAIDPGKEGAIAWQSGKTVRSRMMPDHYEEVSDLLMKLCMDAKARGERVAAYVEKRSHYHVQKCTNFHAWGEARRYGTIMSSLYCLGVPVYEIMRCMWTMFLRVNVARLPRQAPEYDRKITYKEFMLMEASVKKHYPKLEFRDETLFALCLLIFGVHFGYDNVNPHSGMDVLNMAEESRKKLGDRRRLLEAAVRAKLDEREAEEEEAQKNGGDDSLLP